VGGDLTERVEQKRTLRVEKDLVVGVGKSLTQTAGQDYLLTAKRIEIGAEEEYALKVGSASMVLKKGGEVLIKGTKIVVNGTDTVMLKAPKITEN
jgi:type VI secretion system secreted protein VgrG